MVQHSRDLKEILKGEKHSKERFHHSLDFIRIGRSYPLLLLH